MGLSLGAYLSQPVTDKYSSNEENDKMICGVSSMQGWRETQEDAHNCILDYDSGTSFFAVYDGHGGNEVSEYTSQHLPDFLKANEHYQKGDYEIALKDAFVKFDCTLKEPEVVKILQKLAKYNNCNEEDGSESDDENLGSLKAEAQMPIEEVMAKYVSSHKEFKKSSSSEVIQSSEQSSSLTAKDSKSKDSLTCGEVSSNETECSSSKSCIASFNDSDSEVSSSSSSCTVPRKSLSEKYNNNHGGVNKTVLDSTSNGSEDLNSSGKFTTESKTVSELSVEKAQSEKNKTCTNLVSVANSDSSDCKGKNVSCNGNQAEEVISSSVENGEVKVKSTKKGKSLVKPLQSKKEETKESESSEMLFQKFIQSGANEDLSESDSDDVTFNGPDGKSDDDDDDDHDNEDDDHDDNNDNAVDDDDDGDVDVDDDDDDDDDDNENDEDKDEENKEDEDDENDDEEEDSDEYEYENEMDRCFMEPGSDSGCTALVALIKNNKMYVANAGDCRCVVSKNGEAIEMSLDHKPENDIELERIEKAGGRVNAGRVNDGLNLSRALGDHVYKRTVGLPPEEQMISPLPDIQVLDLDPDIEFMVLACDGIWNSMSSEEVVDFVRPRLQSRSDNISKICEEMFDHCLAPNTLCDGTGCDNMTAIIVQFKNSKFFSSKKRRLDESEAEEATKKLKTEDVTSTNSAGSSHPAESFSEKVSSSPDTTQ